MTAFEVNFDGLVGPTHNFAGLSPGNIAATSHANQISSPKQAALQGLQKMRALRDLGVPQGILLPHERPHIPTMKRLGFTGTDAQIIANAVKQAPLVFKQCCSGSAMWVANAATVSPFADTADGHTHFTPANLSSMFHRSIEADITGAMLQRIFAGERFCHHPPLPSGQHYADEGAANHTRLCHDFASPGVEFFVYGASQVSQRAPKKFPARQTLESCQAIARLHQLNPERVVFAQQHPDAIDAGVFHNDVISVGNRNVFFLHEMAFVDNAEVFRQLQQCSPEHELTFIEVKQHEVSLHDAVNSYLFNTQLLSLKGQPGTTIIAPKECETTPSVHRYLLQLIEQQAAINAVHFFDLKQSMNNGGGPACLRLRVVLQEQQLAQLGASVILTDELYKALCSWVEKHYRDRLAPEDLADPQLLIECREALDALTQLTGMGSLYEFQQ